MDNEATPLPEPDSGAPAPPAEPDPRLAELIAERDAARQELEQLRLRHQARDLAREYRFADPEYLEYLCRREQPDLESETGRTAFMETLRQRSPRLFRLQLEPGAPPALPPASALPAPRTGTEVIAQMLAEAPEKV